jgi:hypothetical protein
MAQITPNELKRLFPRATKSVTAANSAPSCPVPEPIVCNGPLAEKKGEELYTACLTVRTKVRVISYRCRLLDPDNLCPKYFIDGLRYARLILNDSPDLIDLTVSQEKVKTKAEEKTLIEIGAV